MRTIKPSGLTLAMFFAFSSLAEVTYYPATLSPIQEWDADSLFLGAELCVDGSHDSLMVWRKAYSLSGPLAELSFMLPGYQDSAVFLFHNLEWLYPDEPDSVFLGRFAIGTLICLRYVVVDTAPDRLWGIYRNKNLYTGQNRPGIDAYVSDLEGAFGKRHAIAGRINQTTAEVGFEVSTGYGFGDLQLIVQGVGLPAIEKLAMPTPVISPASQSFTDSLWISLSVYFGASCSIHYTVNGSTPDTTSPVYLGPLRTFSSVTLKAITVKTIVNWEDSNWVASAMTQESYALANPGILRAAPLMNVQKSSCNSICVYDLHGRLVCKFPASKQGGVMQNSHAPGLFIAITEKSIASAKKLALPLCQ